MPRPCGTHRLPEDKSDGQLRAHSECSGCEAVFTAISEAEAGKDEGGWGLVPTRWTLEPPEVSPGCRLHCLHDPWKSLWDSGHGPSSHGPLFLPRLEGKDQLM